MTLPASARPLLDTETVELITRRVSMAIAGRNADNVPSSARGCGCRVTPDGRLMTVFVSRPQAAALLRDIEANGAIAAVFSQPDDPPHDAVQGKRRARGPAGAG